VKNTILTYAFKILFWMWRKEDVFIGFLGRCIAIKGRFWVKTDKKEKERP